MKKTLIVFCCILLTATSVFATRKSVGPIVPGTKESINSFAEKTNIPLKNADDNFIELYLQAANLTSALDSKGSWAIGTTAPTDHSFLWFDTNFSPSVLKRWNGSTWETTSKAFDTPGSDNKTYGYKNGSWVDLLSGNVFTANALGWTNQDSLESFLGWSFKGVTDYNNLTNKPTIPSSLADLSSDSTHRTVTDTEKGKLANTSGTNTGDQTTVTGNAGTATKLQTARTIGGVSFDGSANINLPGVNATGNQNTTGNAATATKLQTPQAASATPFSATSGISATTVQGAIEEVKAESTVPTGSTGQVPVYNSSGEQVATTPLTPVAGSNITLTTDNTAGTVTIASTASGSGYANLTSFIDQTAWRLFYSDGSGDVKELGLGVSGQVLKSQGASAPPVWGTDNTAAGVGYVSLSAAPYSDSACTTGQYGYYDSTAYLCTGGFWVSKWTLSTHSNPAPATYSLTIDGTGWDGTDSVTVGGSTYTADGTKTGLSGSTSVTVTPGPGRTATVSGTGVTGSSSPYSADMSANRTMSVTFSGSSTTIFSDDFNRADGALGSNWGQAGTWQMPTISSGTIRGAEGDNNLARVVSPSFPGDQKATVAASVVANAGDACVRIQSGADSGYCIKIQSSSELRIVKITNGTEETLQSISTSIANGDTISLSAVGSTLTPFKNGSSLTPTASDSTYSSGQPGTFIWSGSVRLDNFYAESL